jgi:hypothetical protein
MATSATKCRTQKLPQKYKIVETYWHDHFVKENACLYKNSSGLGLDFNLWPLINSRYICYLYSLGFGEFDIIGIFSYQVE